MFDNKLNCWVQLRVCFGIWQLWVENLKKGPLGHQCKFVAFGCLTKAMPWAVSLRMYIIQPGFWNCFTTDLNLMNLRVASFHYIKTDVISIFTKCPWFPSYRKIIGGKFSNMKMPDFTLHLNAMSVEKLTMPIDSQSKLLWMFIDYRHYLEFLMTSQKYQLLQLPNLNN